MSTMVLLQATLTIVPENTSPSTKKKQKMKGKTLALTDFLSDEKGNIAGPGSSYVLAPKSIDWAAEMEKEEVDDFPDADYGTGGDKPRFDRTKLLTAPKAARGADMDTNRVPKDPPFTAFIGNLPYEADEEGITFFFRDLKVSNVRLPMENGRLRGFGYVEFPDRQSLIDGIAMNDMMMNGRKIRVDLADQHQQQGGDRDRGDFGRDDGKPDRTEGDWRRAVSSDNRDDEKDDKYGSDKYGERKGSYGDRYGGGQDGGRDDRFGRHVFDDRGPRDSRYGDPSSRDRGFGGGQYGDSRDGYNRYDDRGPRDRGSFDRPDGTWSSYNRNDDRDRGYDRLHDDSYGDGDRGGFDRYNDRGFSNRDRYYDEGGKRSFGSGHRDGDRYSNRLSDEPDKERPMRERSNDAPASRPRLHLQPRSKPVENLTNPEGRSSIFGNAKPVDTATKERLIEERLARERDDEKRKFDEEKENRNVSSVPRSRRDSEKSQDGSSRNERRHSSGSSGKGVRNVPPPITSQRSRRDSDLSNHSDTVFSGGEETKNESKVPFSPSARVDPSVKMVPAPPPKENIWEKRKTEHKTSSSPPSSHSLSNSGSESSPVSPPVFSDKSERWSPPASNVWVKQQQEVDSRTKPREFGHLGDRRESNRRQSKNRPTKQIPKSYEEMPKYEEKVKRGLE